MKNRIEQFAPSGQSSSPTIAERSKRAAAAIEESAEETAATVGRWVVDHPLASMAAAFAAGVAIAWFVKRK